MLIDFDPAKDEANRSKHGVSLAFGARVFEDADHVVLPSLRPIDGEDRSVRRSNSGEQRDYDRDPG